MAKTKTGQDGKRKKGSSKGKANGNVNTPPADNRFAGKEYEEAANDLINSTALLALDFDPWTVNLLDKIQFSGKGEEACNALKEALGDRTREQINNPRAYVFTLLTKYKNEIRAPAPAGQNDFKSDFNANAPEFVPGSPILQGTTSNFTFNVGAPEFVPFGAHTPTTPVMPPKDMPLGTPEPVTKVYTSPVQVSPIQVDGIPLAKPTACT